MPALYRASFGYLRRHPWQLGLAIAGIAVGVAVMVAVDLANQSSRKAFLLSMDTLNGQSTHQIVAGPGGVDEQVYVALRVEHGLRNVAPVITGYVQVGEEHLQLLGVDVFAEREFRQFSAPGNVRIGDKTAEAAAARSMQTIRALLTGEASLLLAESTAADLGIAPGDSFEVLANGRLRRATLAGLLDDAGNRSVSGLAVADVAVAQEWLGLHGRLSRIDVRLEDAVAQAAVIAALLPPGTELLSAERRTQTTADMSIAFMTNLSAMSLLALLVGIFLIYNSVAFAVLQRRDLIGILRALGVSRQEVFRLILGEAVLLGAVGSLIGVLAGFWLGERLLVLVARTISDHYFYLRVTEVAIDGGSVAKGLAAGMGATLLAAFAPALEASAYAPRLALARSTLEQRAGSLVPRLALAGAALMALSVLVLALSGRNLVAGLTSLFVLILGFAFCIPVLVRLLSSGLERLAGRFGGTAARLAIGGVGKTLSRTGVAIVALAVAVSATIGVSVMVESFRSSVNEWLGNTLRSDVYVGVAQGTLEPALLQDLAALPGIASFSTSRRAWLETGQGRTRIVAVQMATESYAGITLRHDDPNSVWRKFEHEMAVLVSDSYAYRHDVEAGDLLAVRSSDGPVTLEVAAQYQSYDSNDGALMMSRTTYDTLFDDAGVDSIGLFLEEGVGADAMLDRLREVSAGRQSLVMYSNAAIREMSLGIFDRTFVITNVLYWLAVGVAIIGILGAMLALQLERAREFGILRAIGMTPGQIGVLVTVQTGFIGLLAGLAAIPLGATMAWVLVEVINRRAFGWQISITLAPGALVSALLLAVGAALFAGLYPAWHASRVRPALAMREE